MIDLRTATASGAVQALQAGELSSVELLDAQLERLDRFDGAVNAVVARDAERARVLARASDDARARGEQEGPLAGLPITVKDAFETEGLVTTSGAPELADHVPDTDADAVARLKAAGAIVFGKTNLPLYASDMQTFNEVYGLTRNPWDGERSVGGSSGGSAAALAAGFTLLELGSDIGGSIRNPSHYCGVFGHKPTWGIVSQRGHIPPPPGRVGPTDLNVVGPMGRSVADLELALAVLATDAGGIPGATLPAAPERLGTLRDLRVGVWLDDPAAPTDRAVLDVLEAAVGRLEAAGASLRPEVRPATRLGDAHLVYLNLLTAAISAGYPPEVHGVVDQIVAATDPDDRSRSAEMMRGMSQRHRDWVRRDERRHQIGAEWARVFAQVDVMVTPVTPVAAIPHDTQTPLDQRTVLVDGRPQPYMCQLVWAGLATLPYLPATVVPAGRTAGGLPVGLQVVGPRFADRTTLRAAGWFEEVLGGFVAPPLG
ncbi:MAG TPA: amidase [Acidimicrobiales bacterium]|nr:amidase [Acidimicrobiales bacterium]